jgi:hypothetical protein
MRIPRNVWMIDPFSLSKFCISVAARLYSPVGKKWTWNGFKKLSPISVLYILLHFWGFKGKDYFLHFWLSMNVPMYVCMYVCMYLCMYVCLYLCIYVCFYLCIYLYVPLYVCRYLYMHVCTYVSMYVCLYELLQHCPCGGVKTQTT